MNAEQRAAAREKDPEKYAAQKREQRRRYKKKARAENRPAYLAEKKRAHKRRWERRKNNPEYRGTMNSKCAWNRATKLRAVPQCTTPDQKEQMRRFYVAAFQFGCQVDHIVPLIGWNVSGLHVPCNLQLLVQKDNYEKGNSHDSDAIGRRWVH